MQLSLVRALGVILYVLLAQGVQAEEEFAPGNEE